MLDTGNATASSWWLLVSVAEAANMTTSPLSILSGLTIDVANSKTSLAVLAIPPGMR